ncbi:MAG: hypothetical protein AAF551_02685 [Bacteroidota bacterium]
MESTISKTDQLKQIIHQLEKLDFSEETYFAFKKADELDEFVQANTQGLVDFSKSLLEAAIKKEAAYGILDYDVLSVGSYLKPTYVAFRKKEPEQVKTKRIKRFDVRHPLGFALYLIGLSVTLTCLITGAYTIVRHFF